MQIIKIFILLICCFLPASASIQQDQAVSSVISSFSPTERFLASNHFWSINKTLDQYGITLSDRILFQKLIAQEKMGFVGYHGGPQEARLFQDIIRYVVTEILDVPVRADFVFLRVPGDSSLCYKSAYEFMEQETQGALFSGRNWDNQESIKQHLLSLNVSLYQSYDQPLDFTPYYFLENSSCTKINFKELLKPLFFSLGISSVYLDRVWQEGIKWLPTNRGYILQFFDSSEGYAFTSQHSYLAYSGGEPFPDCDSRRVFYDLSLSDFPQMRLVMSHQTTLNPFCLSLVMKRMDSMSHEERISYEKNLRNRIKKLPYNSRDARRIRDKLLQLWVYRS